MPRVFDVHPLRRRLDLNGLWKFQPVKKAGSRPPALESIDGEMVVPGVWESSFERSHYRGQAWYVREFTLAESGPRRARLVFEAVSHTGRVWLDGRYLGEHYGAHNEFEFLLENLAPGRHRLAVLVDNTFGPHNTLTAAYQDIHTYGGLVRPVYLEILPWVHFQEVQALPVVKAGRWSLDVRVELSLTRGAPAPRAAVVALNGKDVGEVPLDRRGRGRALVPAGRVKLWSPEEPHLYGVSVRAGDDAWQERVGFRTIEVRGKHLLLNGKKIALNGVNRHEFHPDSGLAVPPVVHLRDVEILKKRLGANFVRGSHYPNDPYFLDLCDQHGLLFWEELGHWQPKVEHLRDKNFLRQSLRQLEETVRAHRHHPSVILWGMVNEGDTDHKAARPVVRALARRFRELDPSRPVTFASHRPDTDLCFDLVDVVSLNLYPGWYWCSYEETPAMVAKLIRTLRRRGGNKPLIFSEFGAGAMDGVRSFEPRKWTENYQADLLRTIIGAAQDSGEVTGVAIWQYCDVRTSSQLAMGRIREYNNKGIVTEHREPKLGFWAAQEMFRRPWKILGGRG